MYTVTVKLQAVNGKEDELGKLMRDTAQKVMELEKETITYMAFRNMKNPSEFFFFEQYPSKENWEQVHMNMPHIKEAVAALPELTVGELDITEYEDI